LRIAALEDGRRIKILTVTINSNVHKVLSIAGNSSAIRPGVTSDLGSTQYLFWGGPAMGRNPELIAELSTPGRAISAERNASGAWGKAPESLSAYTVAVARLTYSSAAAARSVTSLRRA
jgi:hypothetical protein